MTLGTGTVKNTPIGQASIVTTESLHQIAIKGPISKTLSVIRQKGESQNGGFKKANHAKISEKQTLRTRA